MMIRLLLCSLAVCLVGLASGCDSGTALQPIWDDDVDSTYTPEPISGKIGFLATEGTGIDRTWLWNEVDLESEQVQTRARLGGFVVNGGTWGGGAFPIQVSESPDGARFVVVTNACHGCTAYAEALYLTDVDAQTVVEIAQGGSYGSVMWSPGSRRVLYDASQVVEVRSDGTVAPERVCTSCAFGDERSVAAAWGASSKTVILAITTPESSTSNSVSVHLHEVDAQTGQPLRQLSRSSISGSQFQVAPGGQRLAYVKPRQSGATPVLLDLAREKEHTLELPIPVGHTATGVSSVWEPTGRYLLIRYREQMSDGSDAGSVRIGIIDTDDPDFTWRPLSPALADLLRSTDRVQFIVRRPVS